MKITKNYLKQVIKEEMQKLKEAIPIELGGFNLQLSRDGSHLVLTTKPQVSQSGYEVRSVQYVIESAIKDDDASTKSDARYILTTTKLTGGQTLKVATKACTNVQDDTLQAKGQGIQEFVTACKKR